MPAPPPLKPVDLHLLLALAGGPLHGYALAARMREESENRLRMLPGNLYAVIRRLVREGLISESKARPPAGEDDRRRRYFALTDTGRRALSEEARRMARMAEMVRARLLEAGDGEVAP